VTRMRVSWGLIVLAFALALPILPACSHPPADATPEGALRLFLDDMDDGDDPTEPWDMLAAGLFGLAFRPTAMRGAVVGDRATVEVFGEDPQSEHASVACVQAGGGWRIEPGFPEP
jgi:hypothetical protein